MNPQPITGTLQTSPNLDGYLVFTPDQPESREVTCADGVTGHVTEIQVNVGHPILVKRAKTRFGGINVDAAMNGETVPACIWVDPETGQEVTH